ncbi:MAG: PQQ-binding-like beta-propeller repeat protein [Gemmataceae bacterium]
MKRIAFLCASVSLWLVTPLQAADWPQWLGPNRDGSTTEVVKPWTTSPKILWRVDVAEGHSSPVIANGKVILHTAANESLGDDAERRAKLEYVTAYDAKKGEVAWVARMEKKPFQSMFGNGPRATPTIADNKVYCFGVTGNFAMFDLATGKLLADPIDLVEEYKAAVPKFGVSAAPLVEAGKVYLQVGGSEGGVVALDAKTGKFSHKYLKEPASYSALNAVGVGADRQIVVLNSEAVFGLPPAGGEPIWRYRFKDLLSESSTTPTKAGDKLIISSVTLGMVSLKLAENDRPTPNEAWRNPKLSCYFSTPVSVGKHLFVVTGRLIPPAQADLHCVNLDHGKILWTRPKIGQYGATLIRTGDDKLLMLEEGGDLVLIQPDAGEYKELSRAKVCGNTWAHPAVADGCLYVRDRNELICVQLSPNS